MCSAFPARGFVEVAVASSEAQLPRHNRGATSTDLVGATLPDLAVSAAISPRRCRGPARQRKAPCRGRRRQERHVFRLVCPPPSSLHTARPCERAGASSNAHVRARVCRKRARPHHFPPTRPNPSRPAAPTVEPYAVCALVARGCLGPRRSGREAALWRTRGGMGCVAAEEDAPDWHARTHARTIARSLARTRQGGGRSALLISSCGSCLRDARRDASALRSSMRQEIGSWRDAAASSGAAARPPSGGCAAQLQQRHDGDRRAASSRGSRLVVAEPGGRHVAAATVVLLLQLLTPRR